MRLLSRRSGADVTRSTDRTGEIAQPAEAVPAAHCRAIEQSESTNRKDRRGTHSKAQPMPAERCFSPAVIGAAAQAAQLGLVLRLSSRLTG